VQRATEQSKTGTFRGYGVEKLLRFSSRLVWLTVYIFFSFFVRFVCSSGDSA
jgi:hypothetical protein